MSGIRVRVELDDNLINDKILDGNLKRTWLHVSNLPVVEEFIQQVLDTLQLSRSISTSDVLLSLDGFTLTAATPASILRDGDLVRLQLRQQQGVNPHSHVTRQQQAQQPQTTTLTNTNQHIQQQCQQQHQQQSQPVKPVVHTASAMPAAAAATCRSSKKRKGVPVATNDRTEHGTPTAGRRHKCKHQQQHEVTLEACAALLAPAMTKTCAAARHADVQVDLAAAAQATPPQPPLESPPATATVAPNTAQTTRSRSARRKAKLRRLRRLGVIPKPMKKARAKISSLATAAPTNTKPAAGQRKAPGSKLQHQQAVAERPAALATCNGLRKKGDADHHRSDTQQATTPCSSTSTSTSSTSSSSSDSEDSSTSSSSTSSGSESDSQADSKSSEESESESESESEREIDNSREQGHQLVRHQEAPLATVSEPILMVGNTHKKSQPASPAIGIHSTRQQHHHQQHRQRQGQQSKQQQQQSAAAPVEYPLLLREPACGDVLAYQILEIGLDHTPQVSEVRRGVVLDVSPSRASLRLTPWPDPYTHPLQLIMEQAAAAAAATAAASKASCEEAAAMAAAAAEEVLALSSYDEHGVLEGDVASFIDLRLVTPAASAAPNVVKAADTDAAAGGGTEAVHTSAEHVLQQQSNVQATEATPAQQQKYQDELGDGTPRNVQPTLGPPKPAARRTSQQLFFSPQSTKKGAAQLPSLTQGPHTTRPVAEMTAAAGAALAADNSTGEADQVVMADSAAHLHNVPAAGLSNGRMSVPCRSPHDAADPAVLASTTQPGTGVGQGMAKPAAAPADAAAVVTFPPSRLMGAPVTTPSVVKTKAGRRGAIGPLLSRLRAESLNAASGNDAQAD